MLNNVDFNRLKIFYYIYSCKSLVGAAEQVHITPSALSQQLTKLEKELGLHLFTRLHKKLIPTREGNILYKRIQPFIIGLEGDFKTFELGKNEPAGHLRIGSPTEFGTSHLPEMIASFQDQYPLVTFTIVLKNSDALLGMLADGEIDFAVLDIFSKKQTSLQDIGIFTNQTLLDESFVLACSKAYYDANFSGFVELESLLEKSFIAYDENYRNLRAWFYHHYNKQIGNYKVSLIVDSVQAVVKAIESGIGLGVVTDHSIQNQVDRNEIVVIKSGVDEIVNKISLVQLQDKVPNFAEKKFISHITHFWEKKILLKSAEESIL